MKILFYTDTHGSVSAMRHITELVKKHKPDVAVCPGDMSIFSNNLKMILHQMNGMGVLTFVIHGNHESEETLKNDCVGLKNLVFLHKKSQVYRGVLFMGYGGGGFSFTDPEFRRISSSWKKKMKGIKSVLITHAPPYDTVIDQVVGESCGNKDIRHFIINAKPDIAVSGHIHEGNGKSQKLGKTLVINPGPNGKIIII